MNIKSKLINKLGWFKCQCCGHYVHSVELLGAPDAYGAVCKHCGWEQDDYTVVRRPYDYSLANGCSLSEYKLNQLGKSYKK